MCHLIYIVWLWAESHFCIGINSNWVAFGCQLWRRIPMEKTERWWWFSWSRIRALHWSKPLSERLIVCHVYWLPCCVSVRTRQCCILTRISSTEHWAWSILWLKQVSNKVLFICFMRLYSKSFSENSTLPLSPTGSWSQLGHSPSYANCKGMCSGFL